MKKLVLIIVLSVSALGTFSANAQSESIARRWNNVILEAIRNDFARPTVHARNLYHHSIICYDAWAAFNPTQPRFFLGQTLNGYACNYTGIPLPTNIQQARDIAISYASYRFLENRYANSPDYPSTLLLANNLMNDLGLDPSFASTDYTNEGAVALGNYLAAQIQLYGLTDGANEVNGYENLYYTQLNPPLEMAQPGNPDIQDPNHWQPLALETLIDQSGNLITSTQPHLSPEWGDVHPFSLDPAMATPLTRDGMTFNVYFDSLKPAYLVPGDSSDWDSFYKWNHTLVSVWQSHLDPTDSVMWDISPASIGNNLWYPTDSSQYAAFYDLTNGGDPGVGHAINPATGAPYTPQIVPRADYARVLAEFWADGIDSETPPGHWFEIYHYVTDQPAFERKWKGTGPVLDALEYDVKAHLTLGGTMHDAAICAWSLKGYYDYLRPVSAIRFMADQGQSSDTSALNYHPDGIPLLPGYVEVVQVGDTLAGQWNEHVGKIKLFTWRGHDYITNPLIDMAGVGWILAENWWPYQRPTFVTPPFAGFVSGHSTFSRAAAHTMEFMTGSPFFPGGMGEFIAPMDEFLQFEEGPSDTVRLQWATYIDASDQCSLSRIWGGIHPPIDDIPGRIVGDVVGPMASQYADSLFSQFQAGLIASSCSDSLININDVGGQFTLDFDFNAAMDTSVASNINWITPGLSAAVGIQQMAWIDSFHLQVTVNVLISSVSLFETKFELTNLVSATGFVLPAYSFIDHFIVDTKRPEVATVSPDILLINDNAVPNGLNLTVVFDEPCDTSSNPTTNFQATNYLNPTLLENPSASGWVNDTTYTLSFTATDFNERVDSIDVTISGVLDIHENPMDVVTTNASFEIDTENPLLLSLITSDTLINQASLLNPQTTVELTFNEDMDTSFSPMVTFFSQNTPYSSLQQNTTLTSWIDAQTLHVNFTIFSNTNDLLALNILIENVFDEKQNDLADSLLLSVLWSDMKSPEIQSITPNNSVVNDSLVGTSSYFVDVHFNEPVDTSVLPFLLHQASQNTSGSIQYNVPQSEFLDSLTFRAYFQVFDENIEISTIDLEIGFAKDVSGNPMTTFTENNFVSLDTKNPQAIGLYANTSIVNQWGQAWEVLTVYDEPMRQSQIPSVQLSAIPVNFPEVSSGWMTATNYGFNHELLGIPSQNHFVDIEITGAKDLAGNTQLDLLEPNFLQLQPLLGLDDIGNTEKILLYPNPASEGAVLVIQGLEVEQDEIEVVCLNPLGQELAPIRMTRKGNRFVSDGLPLSSGWYVLKFGPKQFKLIVR